MRYLLIPITLLTLVSCHQQPAAKPTPSLRDSVIHEHFAWLDSLNKLDTTEPNYKDSIVSHPKLSGMNVDEAYRFKYAGPFSPVIIGITISKKDDAINLHYILFRPIHADGSGGKDTVLDQFDKPLTKKDWENFAGLMVLADFWGLKETNGRIGLDGDDLEVWGYANIYPHTQPARLSYVHRWSVHQSSLDGLFPFLLKLSGAKSKYF